jgi:hypothetical protein
VQFNDTFTLVEYSDGFYLFDNLRRVNVAMQAKSKEAAVLEALTYYQKQLKTAEETVTKLNRAVYSFWEQLRGVGNGEAFNFAPTAG